MEHPQSLVRALERLDGRLPAPARERLAELRRRLREDRLRVLIVGEAKRGKSTVVNALLGRLVMPTGVVPVTALPATVTFGEPDCLSVGYRDGRVEERPIDDLPLFVTESANSANRLGVTSVVVRLDAPLLARGVEIVDTPGVGSVHEHNTAQAESALETMDAAVFVLTADPPVSASERELLARVAGSSVRTFVLLNKVDYMHPEACAEALAFTRQVVEQATGVRMRVYPVSARRAAVGIETAGFAAFTADFADYLRQRRATDLRTSIALQACGLVRHQLDEIYLAQRAGQMRAGEAAGRLTRFHDLLNTVHHHRHDAVDLASGESRRMLAELNASAEQQTRTLSDQVRTDLERYLSTELSAAGAGEIEEQGREHAVTLIRDVVEQWRDQQGRRLEGGLSALDDRAVTDLTRNLNRVRESARHLLDLELALPDSGGRLLEVTRFFYDFPRTTGQIDLLAGTVRRALPGEIGRRRAREHVLREAADLACCQVGRSRADLQYRLSQSTRRLVFTLENRHAEAVEHLIKVLDQVEKEAGATSAETAARQQALREEAAELTGLTQMLESFTADAADVGERGRK
ncbi:dynamin family protein [Sphaerimonospora cavernae]|uniref:Dynamin family protein n=1 Tax=Sphaerimonospora cavernae TaxID=1740611 RepID=A0ABV6TXI1_9ACTN